MMMKEGIHGALHGGTQINACRIKIAPCFQT